MDILDLELSWKRKSRGIKRWGVGRRQLPTFSIKMLASEIPTPRKVFSLLEPQARLCFLNKFEEFISHVAKDEVQDFFLYLMKNTKFGKANIIPAAAKLLVSPLLTGISDLYNKTPDGQKASILSLVASHFTPGVLRSHGFDVSPSKIQRAKKIQMSKKATLMGYTRVMPESKRKLSHARNKEMIKFLLENSTISSYIRSNPVNLGFSVKGYGKK